MKYDIIQVMAVLAYYGTVHISYLLPLWLDSP
jgi:hypothetical protein